MERRGTLHNWNCWLLLLHDYFTETFKLWVDFFSPIIVVNVQISFSFDFIHTYEWQFFNESTFCREIYVWCYFESSDLLFYNAFTYCCNPFQVIYGPFRKPVKNWIWEINLFWHKIFWNPCMLLSMNILKTIHFSYKSEIWR